METADIMLMAISFYYSHIDLIITY